MKERTEDEIISMSPIVVTLGAAKYPLKPLSPNKAREWRTKLNEVMFTIVGDLSAEQSTTNIGPAMTAALVAFPDRVQELVFAWAPELPKDKLLDEATEEQFAFAYSAIMVMAYPFLVPLALSMKVTKSLLK